MNQAARDILLWGHSLADYRDMFGLTDTELRQSILECGGGPASFNAEVTARGGSVVSCDPLFALNEKKIGGRIDEIFNEMLQAVSQHQDRFIWDRIRSPQQLAEARRHNIEVFLRDYPRGIADKRYLPDAPPELHFQHFQFDLALCSHFLFASSPERTVEYHVAAIENLCDVAREVRIFPLLDSSGNIPDLAGPVTHDLHQKNLGVEIRAVPYEFQKKGNAMLRVWAQVCEV